MQRVIYWQFHSRSGVINSVGTSAFPAPVKLLSSTLRRCTCSTSATTPAKAAGERALPAPSPAPALPPPLLLPAAASDGPSSSPPSSHDR